MTSSALIYPLGDDPKPLLLERWNRRAQYRGDNWWRGWNAAVRTQVELESLPEAPTGQINPDSAAPL